MKTRIALVALAIAVATAPANAGDVIADLAHETGLSKREVQMIVSNRTSFAQYRTRYDRSLVQFKRALGSERYHRLMAGLPIQLNRQRAVDVAVAPPRDQSPRP